MQYDIEKGTNGIKQWFKNLNLTKREIIVGIICFCLGSIFGKVIGFLLGIIF